MTIWIEQLHPSWVPWFQIILALPTILIQGIEEFINVHHSNPEPQASPLNPTGRSGTLHVIHRLDESSNESSVQVQRLQRELVEKENRIKELEAREPRKEECGWT